MSSSFLTKVAIAATLASGVAVSQDIIHYPFVSGKGTTVINLAPGGPKLGTIVTTLPNAWTTGKSNNGLMGSSNTSSTASNYVDTGWKPQLKNDFTVAWHQKQRVAPGTGLSYLISGVGSFRCFTNGVAAKGFWLRAWGGTPSDLKTATDVQAMSVGKWVHVACVVDWTGTKTATWYINGAHDTTIALTAGASVTGATNMRVGQHTSATSSYAYDIDNFRFSTRAASPGEVAGWAAEKGSGDGPYNVSASCSAKLSSANGPPSLGNKAYQLSLTGNVASPFVLSIGASRTKIAFDLGIIFAKMKGCNFGSSLDIIVPGNTGRGTAILPLPIPNIAALKGANLWNQAIVLVNEQGSNGWNMFIQ